MSPRARPESFDATVRAARSFCGNPDCSCVWSDPEPCEEWMDPLDGAPEPPFHGRCARCGKARWAHELRDRDAKQETA